MSKKLNFNMRGFTSLLITVLAIIEIISSIVLYVAPAIMRNSTNLGLTRNEWKDIHINVGFIFILALFFHLIYNWKILTNYIKKKGSIGIHLKWETLTVIIISGLIFVGSYKGIPPLSYITDFGMKMKMSVPTRKTAPQQQRTNPSLMPISVIAQKLNIPLSSIFEKLKKDNISIKSENSSLKEIAVENNISVRELFMKIMSKRN